MGTDIFSTFCCYGNTAVNSLVLSPFSTCMRMFIKAALLDYRAYAILIVIEFASLYYIVCKTYTLIQCVIKLFELCHTNRLKMKYYYKLILHYLFINELSLFPCVKNLFCMLFVCIFLLIFVLGSGSI